MATVELDPKDLLSESESEEVSEGAHIVLTPSAYDVPRSLTVERDVVQHLLKIIFRYFDQERAVVKEVAPDLVARLGETSRKVLGFELKEPPARAHDIAILLARGVEAQLNQATEASERLNYRLIRKVIDSKLELLLAE